MRKAFGESGKFSLIRGAAARDYSGKHQAYRKLIESRETRIQFRPK